MNALFGKLTAVEDMDQQAEDRLGGFQTKPSGAYDGTIKAMYAGAADSGAQNITVIVELEDGSEFRETIYYTNKDGENFYITKEKKKAPLPGFITVDHLCLVATGKPLCEQPTEDKVVKIYDKDAGREVPKTVPMLVDTLGKPVTLGLLDVLENKSKKNDQTGKYEDIADTRTSNTIDKVFDTASKLTVVEARNETAEATFYPAWVEKNTGVQRDKRSIKDGATGSSAGNSSGQSGRPGGSSTGAKSLFGNKAA